MCIIQISVDANKITRIDAVTESINITDTIDMHILSSSSSIANHALIDIRNINAWLFFDNIKPSFLMKQYSKNILINGEPLDIKKNARICIYRQGSVIIPQNMDSEAMKLYEDVEFKGEEESLLPDFYYTNHPDTLQPSSMVRPLTLNNKSHSMILRRGYMATVANEANGMGYSRVFIADTSDIMISELPRFLNGKISFVRVTRWQYPSKKGWCGTFWKEMVNGLQYAPEQCDATNSTWYYNWGKSRTVNPSTKDTCLNQEFVPEKWGAGGSWHGVFTVTDAPHLLGYNEPDHSEQSNVSVETAIKEWPNMIKTGLRLGSPATTDFTWLYSFMSEARKRNYRVDYVAIHAYWGGLSGNEWYAKLKDVYDRTGRPLWITEWNNGANWTKEGWPSGTADQQAKQLNDLKNILTVMDTAHFVERYAIYNWVEDKRAIILKTGTLTPAGEYYTADTPKVAFTHQNEVIPTWTVYDAPVLSYDDYSPDRGIAFSWKDENGELIHQYRLEKSINKQDFYPVDTVTGMSCLLANTWIDKKESSTSFRIKSIPLQGTSQTSNTVNVNVICASPSEIACGRLLVNENWQPVINRESQLEEPLPLLGAATYRNKLPLSWRARHLQQGSFDLRLTTWNYQQSPSLANPDTIAYLLLPKGRYETGKMTLIIDTIHHICQNWRFISFSKPFDTTPAVFTTLITDSAAAASSVSVRNITYKGFEVKVQHEGAISQADVVEAISFVAVTPGTMSFLGKTLHVGISPVNAVGDNLSGGYTIRCNKDIKQGIIFANMQTANDSITSVLRIRQRTDSTVTIIKDREKSTGYDTVKPEQAAWMIIGDDQTTDVKNIHANINDSKIITIYDMTGKIICENCDENDIRSLKDGIYMAKTKDRKIFKFLK